MDFSFFKLLKQKDLEQGKESLNHNVSVQTHSYSGRVEHMDGKRKKGGLCDAGERKKSQENNKEVQKTTLEIATKGTRHVTQSTS